MILADTSVWIDYFRGRNAGMRTRLGDAQIATHPFVIAELALGSLRERRQTLAYLGMLPQVRVANLDEVQSMIERHKLYNQGIGLVDAHLIASVLLTPSVRLWTRDKRLYRVAGAMRMLADAV